MHVLVKCTLRAFKLNFIFLVSVVCSITLKSPFVLWAEPTQPICRKFCLVPEQATPIKMTYMIQEKMYASDFT